MRTELAAPIVHDREGGGYRYARPGFQIPAAALSERDLFALMVAEQAVVQYGATPLGKSLRGAFDKLLAALPSDLRARHALAARAIHFQDCRRPRSRRRLWATLVEGILTRRKLTIEYFAPARGRVEPRRIEPYLLVARDREWFLVGRTETNRHDALFYVPRIRRATLERGHYEVDPDFSPERYYEHGFNAMHGSGPPQRIELNFAPSHAHLAEERPWAPDQEVVQRRTVPRACVFAPTRFSRSSARCCATAER
jgi:predicted DNA-binding transcriptional regulator YafY